MKNKVVVFLVLAVGLAFLASLTPTGSAFESPPPTIIAQGTPEGTKTYLPVVFGNPNWPLGVAAPLETGGSAALENLGNIAWFYNYWYTQDWDDPRFIPTARVNANPSQVASYAAAHPGRVWLFFGEPDMADQDNAPPGAPATRQKYEALWDALKNADPTAKILCCGTGFSNTAWLETFRQTGVFNSRPVDGVHFHGYPCSRSISQECVGPPYYAFNERYNTNLMTSKLNGFYNYVQSHAEFSGKPIWMTEIGCLSTLDWDTRQQCRDGLMNPLLTYLQAGGWNKFERVAWFSTRYLQTNASDLTLGNNSLTVLGTRWNTVFTP